jgi:ribosomal protein S18 acetylase RimI-like enzyme
MDLVVREAREDELDEVGAVTVEVYGDGLVSAQYLEVLRDARSRWDSPDTAILVALDDGTDGLLGTVVHAGPDSPWRDLGTDGETEIRMLGVLPAARGRGVGEALVRGCIARARSAGAPALVLSTTPEMQSAHRLYARLGFARTPERDWAPRPGLSLIAYVLDLGTAAYCAYCGKPTENAAGSGAAGTDAAGAGAAEAHAQCASGLELEPPRHCPLCGRRMVVQVLPTGWTARCSRHGESTSASTSASSSTAPGGQRL